MFNKYFLYLFQFSFSLIFSSVHLTLNRNVFLSDIFVSRQIFVLTPQEQGYMADEIVEQK